MWLAWFCVDTCIYLYINTALYHSDRDYSTLLLLWIGFFHDSWGRMQVIGTPSNRPAARQDWNKCQSTRSSKILVDSDPILHDLLCYNLDIHDIYVFLNSLSMTGSTTMYLYIYIYINWSADVTTSLFESSRFQVWLPFCNSLWSPMPTNPQLWLGVDGWLEKVRYDAD